MKTPEPHYACEICDDDNNMHPANNLFLIEGEWLCEDHASYAEADLSDLPRLDRELKRRSEHEFNERCNLAINAAQGIFPKSGS